MIYGGNPFGPAGIALVDDGVLVSFFATGPVDVTPTTGPAAGVTATGVGNSVPGESHFWNSTGSYLGTGPSTSGVTCFTSGTHIATNVGLVPVEDLVVGDFVLTRDNGYQKILWTGDRHVHLIEQNLLPERIPIFIPQDAFSEGCPDRGLLVSPLHNILMRGEKSQLYLGEEETLISAKFLVDKFGCTSQIVSRVSYFHFLCRAHELVLVDGIWTDSFYPENQALSNLSSLSRMELLSLFGDMTLLDNYKTARKIIHKYEIEVLF